MKDIFVELREALDELKKTEAARVYAAVENREFPPLAMNPVVVSKTVHRVLAEHKVTLDELFAIAAQRELSPSEVQLIRELKDQQSNQ